MREKVGQKQVTFSKSLVQNLHIDASKSNETEGFFWKTA